VTSSCSCELARKKRAAWRGRGQRHAAAKCAVGLTSILRQRQIFLVIFEHPDSLFLEKSRRLRDANAENWQDLVMGDGESYGEFEGHVITRKN